MKTRRLVEAVNETRLGEAEVPPVSQTLARASAAAVPGPCQDDVVFHGVTSSVAMASLGNVLVTSWSGPVTQASVNFLIGVADALRRERGPLAHLSIVEAESPKAQSAVFPWREPKDLLEKTIDQVRAFLRSHQPVTAGR